MGTTIKITDVADLAQINELVHDHWFDLADVKFDDVTSTLQIRFLRPELESGSRATGWSLLRKVNVPYVESFLRLHHVQTWTLEDTQRVGSYDFNELRFDEAEQRIHVTTGIPLCFHADVETLEVSVLITDKVVKLEQRLAFFA